MQINYPVGKRYEKCSIPDSYLCPGREYSQDRAALFVPLTEIIQHLHTRLAGE